MINIAGILVRARRMVAGFATAEGGNVLMTFTLATVPLVGAVGAAVDYSRANSAKTALQAAVDSSALMLSREVRTLTSAQLNQKAFDYVRANLNRSDLKDFRVTPTYIRDPGGELTLTAEGKVETTLAGVIGFREINISAESTIKWGNTKLRVALVLDTTGSMNDSGKMPALKTAAKNLLTQLQSATVNNGDVYVSIIPFSKNVNVGSGNFNANWIDWSDWEAEPGILQSSKPSSWYTTGPGSNCPFGSSGGYGFACVSTAQGSSNVSTIPSSGNSKGLICPGRDSGGRDPTKIGIIYNGCYNTWTKCVGSNCACTATSTSICSCTGSGPTKTCQTKSGYYEHTWRPTNTNATYTPALTLNAGVPYATPTRDTWNGCVTDRGTSNGPSNDYDRRVTAPSTSISASLFPAEQNSYCSPEVMALSYNWTNMMSIIDGLYPLGATNQPIGLVWGWQSLVGGGPFPAPPAKDPRYKYNEVIVLMSDGLNTLNRWHGNGSSTNTLVDQRMHESLTAGTCANVKAAGIKIYAVHVNTYNDPMSKLLQSCASSPEKFWMVTSGAALIDVFKEIGADLSQLRIAK